MQPPPPSPPGLFRALPGGADSGGANCRQRREQQPPGGSAPGVDSRSGTGEKRPYWRDKQRGGNGTPAQQQQYYSTPAHGAPYFAGGQGTPQSQTGHGGYTSVPPPPPSGSAGGSSSSRGRGRDGGSHAYSSASTPISVPRSRQQRRSGGGSGAGTPGGSLGGSTGGTPTPPRFGGSSGVNSGSGGTGSSRKSGRRSQYYPEHLPGSLLQQGLKRGSLFRGVLRTNPSDRTQAFCTLPGLPTDVFIRGLKLQNRAVEGDEVAIRMLPPAEWYQLASSKAAAEKASTSSEAHPEANTGTASAGGAANASSSKSLPSHSSAPPGTHSNVVPLPKKLAGAAAVGGSAPPPTPLTAAVRAGPGAMTPPAWAGSRQRRPMGDLVASPALMASGSGGELAVAMGPTPVHSGTCHAMTAGQGYSTEEEESVETGSVSSEGGLAVEEQEALLATVEEDMMGLHLDTDIAGVVAGADGGGGEASSPQQPGSLARPGQAAPSASGKVANERQQGGGQVAAGVEQEGKEAEGGEEEEEGPESLADFLVKAVEQKQLQPASSSAVAAAPVGKTQPATTTAEGSTRSTPPAAGSTDNAAAGGGVAVGGAGVDPRLACWHPVGDPAAVVEFVADQLRGMEGWRVTGEVVAVLEPSRRRETLVGVLKQEGDKDTGTFFLIPCDPRLPRMMVRSATLPPQIKQVLKSEAQAQDLCGRTLVSARVAAWEASFPFPLAQVRSSLGQAGDLSSETSALLSMEGVKDDDQFSPEVLACLPPTPWTISEEELGRRRDFRHHRVFSIDPPTARDLDDALHVEELPGGGYRVGVHIADVSHFVRAGTALDREAQQRSTSVYLVDRVIPMLPRLLCEELCSLNPGVDRLAFSVVWDMSAEGEAISTWAGRSVIRSCAKLAYPHVQSMIEGTYLAEEGQEPPCELSGGHSWPDVVRDSLTLHRIASALRKRRFDGGALRLDNTRLYFKLDGEGNPQDYGVYEQREANQLVEEFMLLANMTTARMVAEHFPDRALLRCHPPPNMHKMAELSTTAAELGFDLDTSGAAPLQRCLCALRESAATDPAALEVLTLLATKPMQNARYFCTGETPDESFWRHFALAVTHYTHFTSPIRRYPDIVVHRLMAALLDTSGSTQQRAQRHGLFPTREVGVIAAHANDRKMAAKNVQDGCLRLYLCVMLHRQPLVCDAVVMQLGGSRFFDAYIPALGCDVRIHTNTLLRGGDAAMQADWLPEDKVLELRYAPTATDPRQQQQGPQGQQDEPDYTDIPNLAALRNPAGIVPVRLPLTLRMLSHVPILVSSRRSQTSGSPTHVVAKLWLSPAPGCASDTGKPQAAAAGAVLQEQREERQPQAQLREALVQGIQETWD